MDPGGVVRAESLRWALPGHHLPADWDCGAMMTGAGAGAGSASSVLCVAICASTEVATASAAERALSPLGAELCWMTGAGEPVGSALSLGLSAPRGNTGKHVREPAGSGDG